MTTFSKKFDALVDLYKAQYLVSGEFVLENKLQKNSPRFREFIEKQSENNPFFFMWFFDATLADVENLTAEQEEAFEDFLDAAEENDLYSLVLNNETSGEVISECDSVSFDRCRDRYQDSRRYFADYSEFRGGSIEIYSQLIEATVCSKKF